MTTAPVSVRAILVEQTERTRQSSKADIARFIEESERKITSLESQIRSLVELRDREWACLDSLRYLMSPIRGLPIELLVEIFRLAIDDKTHVEDAYRISQICADWREVAHTTPRLWTRPICVDLERRSGSRGSRGQLYADGLEAWLARSAPLPLPVSIKLDPSRADSYPRILDHVFRIAPRIRSLCCPNFFPLSVMRRLAECRLDSLEELELAMSEPDISEPELPPLITAPRLRKTRLTIWSDAPPVLIPWAQLTNLTLTSDSPNIILEILAQCTTLTYAYIRTPAWRAYVAPQLKQPLPSSHLHTLSLDFGYPEHMMHFLGSLSTPALEALHLNFTWVRDAMESEEPLAGFLIRTPNITRLEILSGRHALTSHELIAVIEHTPGLTHLKLAFSRYHFLDNALIDALSYKDDVAPLVPHLHNLVLNNIHQNGFSTDALEHLFVSRWADATSSSGLPSVARWSHLELRGKYSEESANMMEKLQRQGLPLELQFQKSSRTLLPNYKLPLRMEGDF